MLTLGEQEGLCLPTCYATVVPPVDRRGKLVASADQSLSMNDLVASNNLHSYTVLLICILPHTHGIHTYIGFLLPLGWVVFITHDVVITYHITSFSKYFIG